MKKITTILLFLGLSAIAFSQIPNAGFENWTNNLPDNWLSNNGPAYVAPDSNAHSGYLSLRFQTVNNGSSISTTTLYTRVAPSGSYYPTGLSAIPVNVTFWAVTNLVNGDVLTFNTTLKNGNNIVGIINGTCVSTNSGTWQLYSFPIHYTVTGSLPDSSATWFSFRNGVCTPNANLLHDSTYVLIDDLSFDNSTDIQSGQSDLITHFITPNPAHTNINITYSLKAPSDVSIIIHDITGREVYEMPVFSQASGIHTTQADVSRLTNGVYFMRIVEDTGESIHKFIINH